MDDDITGKIQESNCFGVELVKNKVRIQIELKSRGRSSGVQTGQSGPKPSDKLSGPDHQYGPS